MSAQLTHESCAISTRRYLLKLWRPLGLDRSRLALVTAPIGIIVAQGQIRSPSVTWVSLQIVVAGDAGHPEADTSKKTSRMPASDIVRETSPPEAVLAYYALVVANLGPPRPISPAENYFGSTSPGDVMPAPVEQHREPVAYSQERHEMQGQPS